MTIDDGVEEVLGDKHREVHHQYGYPRGLVYIRRDQIAEENKSKPHNAIKD